MNIVEFKQYMSELIQDAYDTATKEGSDEILFPFVVKLKDGRSIEFSPLGTKPRRDYHLSQSS